MKCEGCGAELAEGAKTCAACGRPVGLGREMVGGAEHLGKETGAAVGKVGKGIWGEAKKIGGAAKKEFKGKDQQEQKKE